MASAPSQGQSAVLTQHMYLKGGCSLDRVDVMLMPLLIGSQKLSIVLQQLVPNRCCAVVVGEVGHLGENLQSNRWLLNC